MRFSRPAATALMVMLFGSSALSAPLHCAAADTPTAGAESHGGRSVPSSVAAEHRELQVRLHELLKMGGDTGRAAQAVDTLLRPHFIKEEQFALPPLRALSQLASGQVPADAEAMVNLADQLMRDMPVMLSEHEKIHGALRRLQTAAEKEGKPEGVQFAKALAAHAAMEEQVFYPAAVLVGRYLKLKAR